MSDEPVSVTDDVKGRAGRSALEGAPGAAGRLSGNWNWVNTLILLLILCVTGFMAVRTEMRAIEPGPVCWEYQVVEYWGTVHDRVDADGAGYQNMIDPSEDDLRTLGQQGWELAGCYLEMETAFPNFGNEDYVTGIRDNIRPQRLVLIFRRPIIPGGQ